MIKGKLIGLLLLAFCLCNNISAKAQEDTDEVCQINDKKALALYDEAIKAYRSGKTTDAKARIQEALEKEPKFAKAYILLGEMAYGKNDEQAAEYYEKSIKICSTVDALVIYKLGLIHYGARNFEKSRDRFSQFLDMGGNKADMIHVADSLKERSDFYANIYKHPVPFDPQPLEGVNTAADEYLPILSPDNEILLFTRRYRKEADKFSAFSGSKMVEEFTMSKKQSGAFDKGEALPRPFNAGLNEGGASLTLDNKHLYITVCNVKGGMGSCDLWESLNQYGKWTELQNLGSGVNDSTWQSQASISSDGKTLYFASDREGGFGGKDIWMIHKDSMGYWSAPNNLGPAINTAGDEKSPFIHTDDLTLYFSSTGHPNLGGFDIFFSKKDSTGNWQKPVNIGYPINSESDDLGFFVSTDGSTGFFATNKGKGGPGGWDIYSFPLYESARPEKVMLMKGKVFDEKGKAVSDAKIDVKDLKTNEITHIDVDSSGEYVFAKALRNDQMVMVTKEGYFYSSETFKKEDKKSTGVSTLNFSIESLHKGGTYKIKNLFFSNKSAAINDLASAELSNLLHFMMDNADLQIEVQGHTDNVGNDNDNLVLSQNRAKAVYEFLINNGITATRVRYKGYGETKPVASNDTEDGRAKNRRTEIVIL